VTDQRASLAAQQAELLEALLSDGPLPPGFDADRVRAQSRALVAKRRAVVSRQHPELVERLGERFSALFEQYCRDHPPRIPSNRRKDAENFHRWLVAQGAIPKRGRRWFGRWPPSGAEHP
jgi:hypothetical protein